MKPLFTGTGTALITPFKNGEIDWDALDNLVESQIAGGVSALIAAGTTGEPSTMTWDEHIEVIRFVAERAKDRACVIAGTGSNCTREVIHAANVVKDFGVAAQLVVTPYYNKSTQEGLVAHYTEIAEKTSLPIVVYNVPSRTGVNIQPATLEKICRLPQVVAVKEANADVLIIDTAGRLQNKSNLMDELGKIRRVTEKNLPVDEVLLVLDATTGQNGMAQAKVFAEAIGITGVVLSKLDGSAKGGIVISVQKELGVPVKLVGLGEGPDDLAPFDPEGFVDGILA